MGTSTFGRRTGRSGSGEAAGKRAAAAAESPAVSALEASAQADARAARRAMLHLARVTGLVCAGLAGLSMVVGLLASMMSDLNHGPTIRRDAPQTSAAADAVEPDEVPTPMQSQTADAKKAVSGEQRTAALKFFGFYHLNTRIRSDYCAKLGVDMAAFAAQFRQSQRDTYVRATAIAVAAGLTEERIFADARGELNGLIAADMEKIGQQTGMGAAGGCEMMVKFADKVVPGIDFAKVMPEAHRVLMGS